VSSTRISFLVYFVYGYLLLYILLYHIVLYSIASAAFALPSPLPSSDCRNHRRLRFSEQQHFRHRGVEILCKILEYTNSLNQLSFISEVCYVVVGPSVVCLSVTFVRPTPTQAIEIFGNFSAPFGCLFVKLAYGACTKRPYFHFRFKIWRNHRVRQPRFPLGRGNFGDSAINKGYIAYFSLRIRETAIFSLPV